MTEIGPQSLAALALSYRADFVPKDPRSFVWKIDPSDSRDPILLSILPFPVGQQKGRRRCPVAMEQICDLEEGIIVSGGAAVPYLDFRFSNRCVKGKSIAESL